MKLAAGGPSWWLPWFDKVTSRCLGPAPGRYWCCGRKHYDHCSQCKNFVLQYDISNTKTSDNRAMCKECAKRYHEQWAPTSDAAAELSANSGNVLALEEAVATERPTCSTGFLDRSAVHDGQRSKRHNLNAPIQLSSTITW